MRLNLKTAAKLQDISMFMLSDHFYNFQLHCQAFSGYRKSADIVFQFQLQEDDDTSAKNHKIYPGMR